MWPRRVREKEMAEEQEGWGAKEEKEEEEEEEEARKANNVKIIAWRSSY